MKATKVTPAEVFPTKVVISPTQAMAVVFPQIPEIILTAAIARRGAVTSA